MFWHRVRDLRLKGRIIKREVNISVIKQVLYRAR